MHPRKYFIHAISTLFLIAALAVLGFTSCGENEDVSFEYGVASGDPLSDGVILWTRATPLESQKTIDVTVEVASDHKFTDVVHSSVVTTSAEADYTVKIDVNQLQAGTFYYYRFKAGGATSATGRTKTLPAGDVSSVKLAVFSCSSYPSGHFNVYDHAAGLADIDAVVHLGDYIYDYGMGGFGTENSEEIGRSLPEDRNTETITLEDYRKRYALYRSDSRLRKLHALHPFITVWDDHEVANDAYSEGAENHNQGEGDFSARKMAAIQAYYEWMPIRAVNDQDPEIIYRSFSFGTLLDLHVLDTRLVAREKQLDYNDYFDPQTAAFDAARFQSDLTASSLLGEGQLAWLQGKLTESTATWQTLGQQVLMGRMEIPVELLLLVNELQLRLSLGADQSVIDQIAERIQITLGELVQIKGRILQGDPSVTAEERGRLEPKLAYNLDAWDGYPVDRESVFGAAYAANKNLVVLSGDTHNGWANNLKDRNGNEVGVEFALPSVTAPGIEYQLSLDAQQAESFAQAVGVLIQDLVYANLYERGYMVVTFTADKAESEWIYVDSVDRSEYEINAAKSKKLSVLPGAGNRTLISE